MISSMHKDTDPPPKGSAISEEAEFFALHTIRIKGVVERAMLEDILPTGTLDALSATGHVVVIRDRLVLSSGGLARHDALVAARMQGVDLPALRAAYRAFLAVNHTVGDVCAEWQSSRDEAAAADVAARRLGAILQDVRPALVSAATALERFGRYIKRLERALALVRDGDERFLTNPRVDSFHTVWNELHEEFVANLRHQRESELDD